MELLRPRKIVNIANAIIASHNTEFEYTDPVFNVPMKKSITTVTFGEMGFNQPNMNFGITSSKDERVILFGGMQGLIKSCVDNAEDIKDRIHSILINKSSPSNEQERLELMKMDFMKLKDWFMEDIRKSKIYKHFTVYNSTAKLKPFSKAFNSFILDRNKYTHGQLCFKSPNYEFVLDYLETPSNVKVYAIIDTEIIKSYNQAYIEIKKVIHEYQVALQAKILDNQTS